jgi:hypothetical protein
VMRLPQRRQVDMWGGRRVGREDHIVSWSKPKRPAWMDEANYTGWPATMDIRVLRVCMPQQGFRTRVVLVAPTLLEPQVYAKEDLGGLYRAQWHAEWDLRSIKQTMQMDVLRCKAPAMVRKEIWGHLLVYNLLRAAMAQAALAHGGAMPGKPTRDAPDTGGLSRPVGAEALDRARVHSLHCSACNRQSPRRHAAGPL